MNRFFALLLAASCVTAVGQVTYPYNPDGNADGDIAVGDLQDFLVTYGNPFSPSEIMIEDSTLSSWIQYFTTELQHVQQSQGNNDSNAFSVDIGLPQEIEVVHLPGQAHYYGSDNWFFYSLEFEQGGFLTVNLGKARILRVAKSDSLDLYDYDTGVALIDTPPDVYHHDFAPDGVTIPVHNSQKVILMIANGDIGKTTWTPIQNDYEEPAQDNLGPCQGEFTVNYHGYDYELVEIGDQCWFAENVRFLPRKATSGANVNQGSEDNGLPYSYVYGEDSNDLDIIASSATLAEFGALYNFQASIVWDLCPSGWHIPSDAEWMTLEAFVGVPESELTSTNWRGTEEEAGKKLKSIFWSGTDEYGFGALPGGARYAVSDWQWSGGPGSEEPYALFMTSSFMNGGEVAIAMRAVRFDEEGIWRGPLLENPTGLSVRCIKDSN